MSHYINNNENKKECEGCATNKTCGIDPSYINPETNEIIECPCVNCIVKVICKGSLPCREYMEYVETVKQRGEIVYNFQFES